MPFYRHSVMLVGRLRFITLSSPHSKAQTSPVMLFLWQVKSDFHRVVLESHLLHGCPGNTGGVLTAHRQSWSSCNSIAPTDKDQERRRFGEGSWGSWGVGDPTAPGIRGVGKPTGGRGAKLRSRVEIWKLRRGWMQGQEVGRWEKQFGWVLLVSFLLFPSPPILTSCHKPEKGGHPGQDRV